MMDVDVDLLKWPLIKKVQVEQLKIKMFLMKNQLKPIIRRSEKRKVPSSFMYNIWWTDLADIKLRSKQIFVMYY